MTTRLRTITGWLAALAATALINNGQNLLENGSFEFNRTQNPLNTAAVSQNTQIDGWTVGGANGIMYVDGVMTASDGRRFVQLQFITANYIEQAIATVPGQAYRVSFDASAYVGPTGTGARLMRGKATARSTAGSILATKDFSYDGKGKTFPDVGWNSFTFDFTANAPLTTLRWESSETGNNGGPCVDNARVLPGHLSAEGDWVISGPPVFLRTLPATTQAVVGRPLTLPVEALGDGPLNYQWYRVNNTTFTPIANATNSTYELSSFANNNAGTYAVIASNSLASITNRTSVARVSPPVIVGQPAEQHVVVGDSLNFGPTSYSGSAPDRFQWFKDGIAVEGQTNQTFIKSKVELSDAGTYSIWVANLAGETNSIGIPVLIFPNGVPPWIRSNPLPPERAVQEGSSLLLTIGAQGSFPLTYFWSRDGQLIETTTQNSFSKNGVALTDAGLYSVVISNAFGILTSSSTRLQVYPPQQLAQFKQFSVTTNLAEGVDFTLSPSLVQGSHLAFQWYKRPVNVFTGLGDLLVGANALELPLGPLTYSASGTYTLVATNFIGQAQTTFTLNVVARPIFSRQISGFEGAAGSSVQLVVSIQNFTASLRYQWYRDGNPISNATQSSYLFTLSAETAGSYTVVAQNEAGQNTSDPVAVVLRDVTPSAREFHLVADNTVDAPGRPGSKLTEYRDAHLRHGVVTFQSGTQFGDTGGVYRWQAGVVKKIANLTDTLPSLSARTSFFTGVSAEDSGISHFLSQSTNSVGNQMSVFTATNGVITALATQESEIPGKPGMRIKRYGYTTRAGGKTAFLAMENEFASGGYRCVLVWDGATLQNWVNSDNPLPAGDGIWWGNSAQVGFDGTTLAFWAVDKTAENTPRNGIFMSVNGGTLQKIAFTGDTIPGGGTFYGFNSPPLVHDGKVLFLAQARQGNENMLLEYAQGTLRIIAQSGDAPIGGGAFASLQYGFDYLADGSILFTANGPGQKQGIYNWKNGTVTETLTTLNTLNGQLLRFVTLADVDGNDCLISASFDGNRFGLYTTAFSLPSTAPVIGLSRSSEGLTLTWPGPGTLQESTDLRIWLDLNVPSPHQAQFNTLTQKFYRIIQR